MGPSVLVQDRLLTEILSTLATLVRLFTRMNSNVLKELFDIEYVYVYMSCIVFDYYKDISLVN